MSHRTIEDCIDSGSVPAGRSWWNDLPRTRICTECGSQYSLNDDYRPLADGGVIVPSGTLTDIGECVPCLVDLGKAQ